ncbi:MAG TPA: hypothetical protein PK904_00375 [Bacteroidales bacterium]|nr:hypothetical protein [Bacteroidales bacterium]
MKSPKASIFCFPLLFLFTIIFTGLSSNSTAQVYRDGFIINLQQDTIHGLIKYTGGNKEREICIFRENSKSKPKHYLPGEIAAYGMTEGKFFISRKVNGQEIFLEFLVKGMASFYFYSDPEGPHYFVENKDGELVELTGTVIKTKGFNMPSLYKGKLVALMQDYDSIQTRVETVELNHNSLIDLAQDYNDYICDSVKCVVFKSKVNPLELRIGFNVGLARNKINFGYRVKSDIFESGFEGGLSLRLKNFLPNNERFWIQSGLFLNTQNKYTLVHNPNIDESNVVQYNGLRYYVNNSRDQYVDSNQYLVSSLEVELKMISLKIPVAFNYSILMGTVRPYFGFGLNNLIILHSNRDFLYEDFAEKYGEKLPVYQPGIHLEAGIDWHILNAGHFTSSVTYESYTNLKTLHEWQHLYMKYLTFKVGFVF